LTDRPKDYPEWSERRAREIAESLRDLPGACLPILHALQGEFGYIHDAAIPVVAEAVNLSKAEVVGVVEFYADFRRMPPAPHQVRVCLAESCQAMGSGALAERVSAILGAEMGGRSGDGEFEVEPVYCLGNCALSPALVLDGRLHGRVTPERASALLAEVRR
jgi:formate dehydrogenase subunit gamma